MFSQLILKLISFINTSYCNWYNKTVLKANHIQLCGNITIQGRIVLKNNGSIKLGKNVTILNNSTSNVAGISHPTILCTKNPTAFISIDDDSGISGASIVADKSIKIGKRVLIGADACIWDTDFHSTDPKLRQFNKNASSSSKEIVIEDDVFIGARAIILKGVTIGEGATIGAASIITKNVSPMSIVVGYNKIIQVERSSKNTQ
jgi:acetyltransferase-like isoleucine patch superfamily enzyme